ncbi:SxtJ family membrane protein [Pseudooceanicola sp.]|uniref:SxtJ family membrane protein n=1 Tax=Pseudooceanicola sp. TaxID=1914328 RepID=UPI0035C72EEC
MRPTFPTLEDDDLPSDRRFGQVFAVIFLGLGAFCLYSGWLTGAGPALITGGVLVLVTYLRPTWLHGANRAWALFGLLLGKIVGTLVLGLIFGLVITPLALLFRTTGRDELRLKRSTEGTYWRIRDADRPPSSFRDQY